MSDFNYRQRAATDAYRENWERIFGRRADKKHGLELANFEVNGCPVYIDHDSPGGFYVACLTAAAATVAAVMTLRTKN